MSLTHCPHGKNLSTDCLVCEKVFTLESRTREHMEALKEVLEALLAAGCGIRLTRDPEQLEKYETELKRGQALLTKLRNQQP